MYTNFTISIDLNDPKDRNILRGILSLIENGSQMTETVPATKAEPVEVKPAKTPEDKEPAPKKEKTKKKKAESKPKPEQSKSEPESEDDAPTADDLKNMVKQMVIANESVIPKIKTILLEFGVSKVGELDSKDVPAAYKAIKELEV